MIRRSSSSTSKATAAARPATNRTHGGVNYTPTTRTARGSRHRSGRVRWPNPGALLEHELAERAKRRIERHRTESHLDPTKTLATFDFSAVPMVSKAHVTALATGESWLEKGATVLLFGPPGVGKSHLGSAIGHALIDAGYRVLFTRTSEL
ncbi:ATP-binding protein, partial [Paraburkholderia sp. CNPSo 3076]|uniref:ATP-binding protein n=1 Tax=Paraburkholderia sp. CNPSo 3076 TaxID=2940936 RepID=UPI002B1E6648